MNISNEKLTARSPGITYQQLLDTDTHPVPDVLRMESPRYLGSADISKDRYTTKEFHDLEVYEKPVVHGPDWPSPRRSSSCSMVSE